MSKKLMIGIIIASLAIGAYYYTQSNQKMMPTDDMTTEDQMVKTDDVMMNKEDKMMDTDKGVEDGRMMKESSRYQPFTPAVLAETSSTRRVLFFYASWCPTCIPADTDFTKNLSMLPSDMTVIRVNYSDPDTDKDEKALATKYGITYQHTYVQIDSEGNEILKWNGGAVKELLAKIK